MNNLSLFTGAGGGELAAKSLGWRTVGYVEKEDYCQRIIRQRIIDGLLNAAPIFGDIRTFLDQGYAARYKGMVDVVSAGFPCQPFSVAGAKLGEFDPRNMWPQTIAVIRQVRPEYVFLENVPGLLNNLPQWLIRLIPKNPGWFWRSKIKVYFPSYFGRVLGDLAESGYDARWRLLSAAEVGAPHLRKRLWIVAHANG